MIGSSTGTDGTVIVRGTGASWENSAELYVGDEGTGTLTIEDGGTAKDASAYIGHASGGTGTVTVIGTGSAWTTSDYLTIGYEGTGTLTIADGGSVSSDISYLGDQFGSTGTATVSGAGSVWTNTADFYVGNIGAGTLTIADGGALSNTEGYIAFFSGSTGAVTVSGAGSKWTNSSLLGVGDGGDGALTISDGGAVSNTDGYVGHDSGSTGTVAVSGAGSSWTNSSDLSIGDSGDGVLTIADGGTVDVDRELYVAQYSGSTGTLNIGAAATDPAAAAGILDADTLTFGAGTGTLVFNHTDTDYQFNTAISGNGTISHMAGITTLTKDSSGFTGTTTISDGTVLVDGTLGGSVAVNGGTLGGSGTLDGSVSVTDGTIAAGNSPGTLTIAGDLALSSGSTLDFDLGSPTGTAGVDSDLIVVGGDLTLDGTLNVTDAGGFGAGLYRLIDYGGTLTDNGLDIGTAPSGYDSTNLTVQTATVGQVNLLVDSALTFFWDGSNTSANDAVDGGTGTWDVSSTNWTTSDGSVNDVYDPSQLLIFSTAAGVVTVDGTAGAIVLQNGMQFPRSTATGVVGDAIGIDGANTIRVGDGTTAGAAYSATIASSLTGSGSLTKTDYGTLVLTGDSSAFTGDTSVDGGTLSITGQLGGHQWQYRQQHGH